MADNYLEYARENYEKRKAEWHRNKKKHFPTSTKGRRLEKPEDEAL